MSAIARALGVVMLVLVGSALASPAASADRISQGGYTYSYDPANVAAGATIVQYLGSSTVVSIPESVVIDSTNYVVTEIGGYAFSGIAQRHLTSVTIPSTVSTIAQRAFQYNSFTSVVIPDSVTSIGEGAFLHGELTSVTIPNSVTSLGENAFQQNKLTSVTLPNQLTAIPRGAFGANFLASLSLPSSVAVIGRGAFESNRFVNLTIPDTVTTVDAFAFCANGHLTNVTIPASVTTIGDYAFSNDFPGEGDYVPPRIDSVVMLGPVPATIGTWPFGLGGDDGPLVTYDPAFASTGYTPGIWTVGGTGYRTPGGAAPAPAAPAEPGPSPSASPLPSAGPPTPSPVVNARPSPDTNPTATTATTATPRPSASPAIAGGGGPGAMTIVITAILGAAAGMGLVALGLAARRRFWGGTPAAARGTEDEAEAEVPPDDEGVEPPSTGDDTGN